MDHLDRRSRRRLVVGLGMGLAAMAAGTARGGAAMVLRGRQSGTPEPATRGRLRSRPLPPTESIAPGLHRLGLDRSRDAVLLVPSGYQPERPAPFVLSLHGAGGDAEGGLYPLRDLADDAGLVLLSPASRGTSWDVIRGGFGPDVAFVDAALAAAFARVAVDPARLAVGGFSDGASYALSLGIGNGDLFGHVLAFSPGFAAPAEQNGEPRIFVSHGTRDDVLAIDPTSRRLVPPLKRAGYDVTYVEFDGGHSVPPEIARRALGWFLDEVPATPTP